MVWTIFLLLWMPSNTTIIMSADVEWSDDEADAYVDEDLEAADSSLEASFLNLTVQAGTTAQLACAFPNILDRTTVSWLRRKDGQLHLLSVGLEIYSRDTRYTYQRSETDEWQLSIMDTQQADQGLYECQVTSHPRLAHYRYLTVTVPELGIHDERGLRILSKFYNLGSTVELRCVISRTPRPRHFILWLHAGRVLNFDTTRGGISVKSALSADGARSTLRVADARPRDSGNYTCSLAGVGQTTASVHVLDGELPAAMQHGAGSSLHQGVSLQTLLLCALLALHTGLQRFKVIFAATTKIDYWIQYFNVIHY